MMGGRLGDNISMKEELIKKACHLSMKAHSKSTGKLYIYEKSRSSSDAVFCFPGSWSVNDWFHGNRFGETKISNYMFPYLRSIGNDEIAALNEAFFRRFEAILSSSAFANEVQKAVSEGKQVVFAGHSSGGSIAILAALWFLEKYLRPNAKQNPPLCVTFGSPLVGDRIFPHALGRENWARYFIHFVMRYDIVPRIMLSSLSAIEQGLPQVLRLLNPKSQQHESIAKSKEAFTFFTTVMKNASSVTSHAACNLMGCTNLLLETLSNFIELSPYRPFGTYIFCTGNGKLVVVRNPDAVLQLLFYCSQLSSEAECAEVPYRSLREHLAYENELQESLEMQNVVYLDHLEDLPLSSDGNSSGDIATTNMALNDLGLSTRARLCLRSAGELEKQKMKNQAKIDSKRSIIEEGLDMIQEYQNGCEIRNLGYYDAFKFQKDLKDFNANVKRIELAGIWDEIIEMLKRYELPDGFECRKEWIVLATRYRRLVEPLDIANYYRHLKNDDTGPYLMKARPKRYRFTQRWLEHYERMEGGSKSESCFWAVVEELRRKEFEDAKDEILKLETQVYKWVSEEELTKDIFLDESTFAKWWKMLPSKHKSQSCISKYMCS